MAKPIATPIAINGANPIPKVAVITRIAALTAAIPAITLVIALATPIIAAITPAMANTAETNGLSFTKSSRPSVLPLNRSVIAVIPCAKTFITSSNISIAISGATNNIIKPAIPIPFAAPPAICPKPSPSFETPSFKLVIAAAILPVTVFDSRMSS